MKVLGIIVEYNPMHNGHVYHIKKAKEITKADKTVVVMSGSFTETGNVSILNKDEKAKIAIKLGADLVLELPIIHAVSSSEYFAYAAINLLNSLGIIDYVCFGAECENISILENIADKLILNEKDIYKDIQKQDKNITFAKARSLSLSKYLSETEIKEIDKPNNILGIEYIKSIKKLNSNIVPVCIKRNKEFISSTFIRNKLNENRLQDIYNHIPEIVYNKLQEINTNSNTLNKELYLLLRYKVINMSLEELKNIFEVNEGLENKIKKEIVNSTTYEEFIQNVKSKRYIENKIKRICIYILLDISKEKFERLKNETYVHVLAKSKDTNLLSLIDKNSKKDTSKIITSINDKTLNNLDDITKELLTLDILSTNINSIIRNKNLNLDFTKKI